MSLLHCLASFCDYSLSHCAVTYFNNLGTVLGRSENPIYCTTLDHPPSPSRFSAQSFNVFSIFFFSPSHYISARHFHTQSSSWAKCFLLHCSVSFYLRLLKLRTFSFLVLLSRSFFHIHHGHVHYIFFLTRFSRLHSFLKHGVLSSVEHYFFCCSWSFETKSALGRPSSLHVVRRPVFLSSCRCTPALLSFQDLHIRQM